MNIEGQRATIIANKANLTVESAKGELENCNMRYFNYNRKQLKECIFEMFSRLGLIARFKIDEARLRHLINDVEKNYKRVPYHNFSHAFNIVHMCYYLARTTKLREYLEDVDLLALMVAALGHDIDHSGMNNIYYQKIKHPLALSVNDSSVLENYHGYMLSLLLSRQENSILEHLTHPELTRFRKASIECIMGTDMTKHFQICGSFNNVIKKIHEGNFDKSIAEDRDVSTHKLDRHIFYIFYLKLKLDYSHSKSTWILNLIICI